MPKKEAWKHRMNLLKFSDHSMHYVNNYIICPDLLSKNHLKSRKVMNKMSECEQEMTIIIIKDEITWSWPINCCKHHDRILTTIICLHKFSIAYHLCAYFIVACHICENANTNFLLVINKRRTLVLYIIK